MNRGKESEIVQTRLRVSSLARQVVRQSDAGREDTARTCKLSIFSDANPSSPRLFVTFSH